MAMPLRRNANIGAATENKLHAALCRESIKAYPCNDIAVNKMRIPRLKRVLTGGG